MSYTGTLYQSGMSSKVRRAYGVWGNQRKRCYSKRNKSFKDYGAKGIQVEYSSRDFIGWYFKEMNKIGWKRKDVGRIDHSKNYCFSNIRLETRTDNTKERNARLGNPKQSRPVVVLDKDYKIIKIFKSQREAARELDVDQGDVWRCCNSKRTSPIKGFYFKNYEGGINSCL